MFVTNWISTTKIQKISEITNFFRHYFLSRTEVKLTYSPAIQGYWKGMVLYNSSAAYGGTIFWRPVSNFIIKGVNLNRNFRKVNGSKNKPL